MPCKKDCNLDRILTSNNTWYSNNKADFIKLMLPLFPPQIIPQCKNMLGKYLNISLNPKDILNNISKNFLNIYFIKI